MLTKQEKQFQEIYLNKVKNVTPAGDKGLCKKADQINKMDAAYQQVLDKSDPMKQFTKEI